eukprot:1995720-Amphidinium_carterae.1
MHIHKGRVHQVLAIIRMVSKDKDNPHLLDAHPQGQHWSRTITNHLVSQLNHDVKGRRLHPSMISNQCTGRNAETVPAAWKEYHGEP